MTDEEIVAIRKTVRTADVTTPFADSIAFARAILQARAGAVPREPTAWRVVAQSAHGVIGGTHLAATRDKAEQYAICVFGADCKYELTPLYDAAPSPPGPSDEANQGALPAARSDDEKERYAAALHLIWRIHIRDKVHLGLERFSGVRQDCIACIAALALGRGMDPADAGDFNQRLAEIDAAPVSREGLGDAGG